MLAVLWLLVAGVSGYMVTLEPGVRVCFFEPLGVGDRLGVNYEVDPETGGSRTIDLEISAPSGEELVSLKGESFGTQKVRATKEGKHHVCLWSQTAVRVRFHIHGEENKMKTQDPLDESMRQLTMALKAVADEQEYLVAREHRHTLTAHHTDMMVLMWHLFEYALLIGICVWQVYYLKRFFEVKKSV